MRYFIYLAYDGTNYHGWQIQPNGDSVQETLMRALSTFLRQEIEVVGAGRTDAGVHARLMIAHFDYDRELDCVQITEKLNRLLPPDIAVYAVKRVKDDAHARFDATYRTYKYYVTTRKDPFNRHYANQTIDILLHRPEILPTVTFANMRSIVIRTEGLNKISFIIF